ncbi:hypothetical protein HK404_18820 [Myxococcus xanthus]|nr:hypothetical protein [Myxococcus xanthus]
MGEGEIEQHPPVSSSKPARAIRPTHTTPHSEGATEEVEPSLMTGLTSTTALVTSPKCPGDLGVSPPPPIIARPATATAAHCQIMNGISSEGL